MKVLQISNYYYPHTGGIEQVAKDISDALKVQNIEQKIICFNEYASRNNIQNKREEDVNDFVEGVEVIRCGCFGKISSQSLSFSYFKRLKDTISSFQPDIIIFHYPNPFVGSFLLSLIDKETKFVVYWHLDIIKQKFLRIFFEGQNNCLLKRADVLVATSPNYIEGSKYLSKYKEKCIVIPNCVSIDFENIKDSIIKKSIEIKEKYKGKYLCFTIGRHIPYKGFEYLIESSNYLSDKYMILIGGKGPLTNKLKDLSKDKKNVELLGFLSDEDLIAYYLACDIICFSSITKNEAFGISLAEGMSFGKPAITFTIQGSGVNYVSLNKVTGIECRNKDCKEYAEAIQTLCENKKLYKEYASAAKKRVVENFTKDKFMQNIEKLITKLD